MLYLSIFSRRFETKKAEDFSLAFLQVGRLELPHIAALDPKSNVSTNSTTPAFQNILTLIIRLNPKSSVSTNSTTPAKGLQI